MGLRAEIIWSSQYIRLFFRQNPASLYDKRAKRPGRKRIYLNKVKILFEKCTAKITQSEEKPKAFLLQSGTRQWSLDAYFNIVRAQAIRLEGYERDTNKAKKKSRPLNCGWYNSLCKILWRLIQTLTADIYFHQSNRLQKEHVKSAASLHTKVEHTENDIEEQYYSQQTPERDLG